MSSAKPTASETAAAPKPSKIDLVESQVEVVKGKLAVTMFVCLQV